MIAGRLASILFFVLSLGFLVCAAPSSPMPKSVAHRRDSGSLSPLTLLEGMTRKQLDSCMRIKTIDEAKALLQTTCANIKSTTESLSNSAKVEDDSTAKTDVAVRLASIITLLCKMILNLTQKFGCDAIRALCTEIDAALKGLLLTCSTLANGCLLEVGKKIADIKTEALLKSDFPEVAKLLGFAA